MIDKPFRDMDESQLRAVVAEYGPQIPKHKQSAQAALDAFKTAKTFCDRASSELRDRFCVDARTGKRLSRKNSRDLVDLARRA